MAKKTTILFMSLFCLTFAHTEKTFSKSLWQALKPGISYRQLSPSQLSPFAAIHAFKINLQEAKLSFCPTPNPKTTAKDNAKINQALITLNSGFFSTNMKPLGLRVHDGHVRSPRKRISWWGIFYVKHNKPYIVGPRQYRHSRRVSFAVQSGPRLIINHRIPKLKSGLAERTALGITNTGEIIIVVTEHTSISTTYLAQLMRDQLDCDYALNLDGGGSTQLYAQLGNFKRQVHGFSRIPDPICVYLNP